MQYDADRLSRALERLVRRLRTLVSTGQLTSAAAGVLGRLSDDGPMRVTQLAQAEGVSQPSMTQLLERLANAGLVERKTPEHDRRSVYVHLTEDGLERLKQRRRDRAAQLDTYLDALSADDQAAIVAATAALERLTAIMGDDISPLPTHDKHHTKEVTE